MKRLKKRAKKLIAATLVGATLVTGNARLSVGASSNAEKHLTEQVLVEDIFHDIHTEDWYRDYVQAAYDEKLMTGLSESTFGPLELLSRAQFAVILYRMEGEPAVEYKSVFADVPSGQFYSEAVLWASEAGIVSGYVSGHFGPADSITREQIATMLYRYAKWKGYDMTTTSEMEHFTDRILVSEFAKEPMTWITEQGIITGRDGHILAPQDNTPRAEIATVISRYWQLEENKKGIVLENGYSMTFAENENQTFGTQMLNQDGEVVYENLTPAELEITDLEYTNITVVADGYDEVVLKNGIWEASASVTTENGSILKVTDSYSESDSGICLDRQIEVTKASTEDAGYASRWSMVTSSEETKVDAYEYFIPALFYKDPSNLAPGALFSELPEAGEEVLAKETRMGLPMVMIRKADSGDTISVAHIPEGISDEKAVEEQYSSYRLDEVCQYGSLGITNLSEPGIVFRYPYAETPYYTTGRKGQHCYHSIQEGHKGSYSLFIYGEDTVDYNAAMTSGYLSSFEELSPEIADIDMDLMYDTAQEDMLGYVQEKGTGIGLPFAAYVDDGSIFIDAGGNKAVNFQMGFIGMQIPLAYQMMRQGVEKGNSEFWNTGVEIMNFWAKRCKTDSGVVKVWFDTYDFRPYPAFLRIMTDGMEGMLDAYQLVLENDDSKADIDAWEDMICNYADFLVREQNEDGSFYRAYDYSGNAFSESNTDGLIGDANTQGSSKLNSAVPIRFLIRMYEEFGDEAYMNAAKAAGNYVFEELYPDGKYMGGTADNPNTIDKEAGMYAVYAYSALYSATGDETYLKAMEQAAIYAFSWTYTYKFETANPRNLVAGIPTSLGRNDGMSIIASGHSGSDNMIAYMYYEFYKLYVWTENPIYLEMADFVQNNSRQTMDLNGEYGYARRSFMIEATGIADMVFGTAGDRGIWLPWITCANIEPAADMEDTFGTKDVREAADTSFETLRQQLKNFGA